MNEKIKKLSNFEIETPYGFVDFDGVHQLPSKQLLYKVITDSSSCEVTYKHEFVVGGSSKKLCDLNVGDSIETIYGIELVKDIIDTGKVEYVYDILDVKNKDHSFYGNGILHHNCSFLGSSNTLVDGDRLEQMMEDLVDHNHEYNSGKFMVWDKPIDDNIYLLSVDVSKGVGRDYSVIQVIDITYKYKYRQVAMFRDNYTRPEDLSKQIVDIGRSYNNAYMIVENNTFGYEICRTLWNDYEYENMFREYGKRDYGINANKRSKEVSTSNLKTHIENEFLTVRDRRTYKELTGFIELKPGLYGCEGQGEHDDTVMALVWASYFLESQFWKDIEEFERQQLGIDTTKQRELFTEKEQKQETQEDEFQPVDFSKYTEEDEDFGWV